MRNNILGGLVIFMVVVTCLIMIDDISQPVDQDKTEINKNNQDLEKQEDLVVVETTE